MPADDPLPRPAEDRGGPFEQLERCHRRLEERLDELRGVAPDGAASAESLEALRGIVGFFARAVTRHEADEEESLFPRLAARADLAPAIATISAQHRAHQALHAKLDALLAAREEGAPGAAIANELAEVAEGLARAYRAHIEEEERVVFPAARSALDAAAVAKMADEMAARRGHGEGRGQGERGEGGGRRRA